MKVWARLGAFVKVDEKEFRKNPQKALIEAIHKGKYELNGDSYVPADYENGKDEIVFEL